MAYNLTNETIKMFNEKYGTDLSVNKYLAEAKRTSPNDALISIFTEAYKKVAINDLLKGGTDHKSRNMLADFQKDVIDSLIWELPLNGKSTPDKDAGLSKLDQYNLIEEAWGSIPNNDVDIVAENYKNGSIRIRDMVARAAYINETTYKNMDNSQLKELASYAEALKKVNESRSFIWKVFHPIRNNAEKRDAKLLEMIATEKTNAHSYELAANEAKGGLTHLQALKESTIQTVLGVKNVSEYVPEHQPSADELKNKEIKDWVDKYEGKGLEFFKKESIEFEKEALAIKSLEENPYANNEANEKIEEAPVIDAPNLQK